MASSTTCGIKVGSGNSRGNVHPDCSKSSRISLRAMAREAAREMESRIILETLAKHQWNRRRTAEALNISYRSLMYKMKYCKLRKNELPSEPEAN
jgi:transcriptional regulator with PAS, ATPase and Fis domain